MHHSKLIGLLAATASFGIASPVPEVETAAASPVAAAAAAASTGAMVYPDGTPASTSWTFRPMTIKTPAFKDGPELTFEGQDLDDAYSKLLAVNPAWNCTIVGGCPDENKLKKRMHAVIVCEAFHSSITPLTTS